MQRPSNVKADIKKENATRGDSIQEIAKPPSFYSTPENCVPGD